MTTTSDALVPAVSAPAHLVFADECGKAVRPLTYEATLLGRSPENDVVLDDPRVSRRHARIVYRDGGHMIENLSRKNSVLLNGEAVQESPLHDGDRLTLGQTALVFRAPEEGDTGGPDDGNRNWITLDARNRDAVLRDVDEHNLQDLQRARSDLMSLYNAGREIGNCLSTPELCEKTLEHILTKMPCVDCCSFHLLDPASGQLECRASRFRTGHEREIPAPFSRTLLQSVLNEMQAVLTYDAQEDDRFDSSRSIAALDVRSAMCVPIQVQNRLTGVLQAHALDPAHVFRVEDLRLLTAFGMLAGVSAHNAALYETLEAEKRRQQERAEMMQVMVHELKSPIGTIRMIVQTMLQQPLPREKQQHFMERIVARIDTMLEWIRETLELSRLKSGRTLAPPERIDLVEALCEIAESYREQAENRHLTYRVAAPDTPLPVLLEPNHVRLVLSNLVSNAIKYTPAGSVDVSLSRDDDAAVLQVRDTGIGIPARDQPRLFREFFRASNAKTSGIEGSGVGLASVKAIVERAGGRMELSSEEGAGTTFTVRLPLDTETGSDASTTEA